jgi:ornithine cyclodeaminase
VPDTITVADSTKTAVRQADVICAATTSATPVFDGADVQPGTHINAVGSFTPEMQEVDETTIERARVYVDSREAVMAEAGDLIIPIRAGRIPESHLYAEIGEVALGTKAGRENNEQITYFKSVGVAAQDGAAASIALANAAKHGLGVQLDF